MMPKDEKINRRAFFKRLAGLGVAGLGFALAGFKRGAETEAGATLHRANFWRRLAG